MRILACFSKNLPTRMQYLIGKAPFRKSFEKMRRRSEAREKINRRPVEKRTSVYAFQRQVFLAKNLLLFRTTDIPVRSDMSSIYFFAATREIPTYFQKEKKIAGMPLRCYNPQYEYFAETADRRTEF